MNLLTTSENFSYKASSNIDPTIKRLVICVCSGALLYTRFKYYAAAGNKIFLEKKRR